MNVITLFTRNEYTYFTIGIFVYGIYIAEKAAIELAITTGYTFSSSIFISYKKTADECSQCFYGRLLTDIQLLR